MQSGWKKELLISLVVRGDKMKKILLIGGGGHCKSVIDVIEQEGIFQIAGIIDKSTFIGSKILDYDIIGCDDDLPRLAKTYSYAMITVGQIKSAKIRTKLFTLVKDCGFILPIIVSPRAYVSKHSIIGDGTVIMHDALVNAHSKIGVNCIINTKSLVEHDVILGDHCHLSTAATLNGGVNVSSGTFIGSHATTRELVTIDKNSFIKAGKVVK